MEDILICRLQNNVQRSTKLDQRVIKTVLLIEELLKRRKPVSKQAYHRTVHLIEGIMEVTNG